MVIKNNIKESLFTLKTTVEKGKKINIHKEMAWVKR